MRNTVAFVLCCEHTTTSPMFRNETTIIAETGSGQAHEKWGNVQPVFCPFSARFLPLKAGLGHVLTIGTDDCCGGEYRVVPQMAADPELNASIDILGAHCTGEKTPLFSPFIYSPKGNLFTKTGSGQT